MNTPRLIIFVSICILGWMAPVWLMRKDEPLKTPPELAETRLEAARKAYDAEWNRSQRLSAGVDYDRLCDWSRRWLNAQLAISDKKDDQLVAYEEHATRMQRVEELAGDRARGGVAGPDEADVAKFYRTEAEIWLVQVKGK